MLNKYIPPDFDPAKLPRGKKLVQGRMDVTMMLPMNVQCVTCGNFMYRGTKFNSKKEDVVGEDYLGMKIFRFIMKCKQCNSFFSIKTDPKNADYAVEYGATRNFEPWREESAAKEDAKAERAEEEKYDAMRALENRTEDSKRQLELMDAVDELRAIRAQQAALGIDASAVLAQRANEDHATGGSFSGGAGGAAFSEAADEDEAALEDMALAHTVFAAAGKNLKRVREEEDGEGVGSGGSASFGPSAASDRASASASGAATSALQVRAAAASSTGLLGGFGAARSSTSLRPAVRIAVRPRAAAESVTAPAQGDAAHAASDGDGAPTAKRARVEGSVPAVSDSAAATAGTSAATPKVQLSGLGLGLDYGSSSSSEPEDEAASS